MRLPVDTKLVHFVTQEAIEAFIKEIYSVTNFSVSESECVTDVESLIYNVTTTLPLSEEDLKDIGYFVEDDGDYPYVFDTLMQDLVNRGIIPGGIYIVLINY